MEEEKANVEATLEDYGNNSVVDLIIPDQLQTKLNVTIQQWWLGDGRKLHGNIYGHRKKKTGHPCVVVLTSQQT